MENSEGYGNIIQKRQDKSKNQVAKWLWGRKEALKCKNDLGDVTVLIRYESTESLLAQSLGEMVATQFILRNSFKNYQVVNAKFFENPTTLQYKEKSYRTIYTVRLTVC